MQAEDFVNFCDLLNKMGLLNGDNTEVSGERSFIHGYLSDIHSPVVFDIGANEGLYSMTCLSGQEKSKVYAYEPHPKTFKILKSNVEKFGVTCLNMGMSEEVGTLGLYDYAHADGSIHASIYSETFTQIFQRESVRHVVPMSTVDQQIEMLNLETIDLLKIDTEGHELAVLKGGEKAIRENRVKAIQFEFNEHAVYARTFFRDFWDFLPEYDFYRLLPDGALHFSRYSSVFCEVYAYQNIVCLRKGMEMPLPVFTLG